MFPLVLYGLKMPLIKLSLLIELVTLESKQKREIESKNEEATKLVWRLKEMLKNKCVGPGPCRQLILLNACIHKCVYACFSFAPFLCLIHNSSTICLLIMPPISCLHYLRSSYLTANAGGQAFDKPIFTGNGILTNVLRFPRSIKLSLQIP